MHRQRVTSVQVEKKCNRATEELKIALRYSARNHKQGRPTSIEFFHTTPPSQQIHSLKSRVQSRRKNFMAMQPCCCAVHGRGKTCWRESLVRPTNLIHRVSDMAAPSLVKHLLEHCIEVRLSAQEQQYITSTSCMRAFAIQRSNERKRCDVLHSSNSASLLVLAGSFHQEGREDACLHPS